MAFALDGEVYRQAPGRKTLRVQVGAQWFFVKLHFGVGWREVIKNWLTARQPIWGAYNEFVACRALQQAGIPAPTPAAYAAGRGNLARRRSFVLCDELAGYVSLETLADGWLTASPSALDRQRVLYAVARFARRFHACGFVHRDFYICHLLVPLTQLGARHLDLAVLDLHRARRYDRIPNRWLKRDLAALMFSSLDFGFTPRHWLRFLRLYSERSLRDELAANGAFWRQVQARAHRLYAEGQRKGIVHNRYRPPISESRS